MVIKKKIPSKEEPIKKLCGCCKSEKLMKDYYYSSSYVNQAYKSVQICKQCMWDYVTPEYRNVYDMKLVKTILRMVDKPFLQPVWESSVEEASKRESEYFKIYMKNIAMKDFRELTWSDSNFGGVNGMENDEFNSTHAIVDEEMENVTEKDMAIWRKKWGDGNVTDYLFLEEFYGEYEANFPTDTPAQINIYKNLAKIHLNAEKALEKNDIKNFKDLMDLSSRMHNDAKIKPIQSNGNGEDKGLSNYGMWIRDIENTDPCEYFKDKPLYEDFDGLKGYFEKWVLRPMLNTFNKGRDFEVGDD